MYALIDCNNFFVACEQVFDPKLRNKPVAVLSNNDGCIVSRSQEVKDLGIPMGAPVFKYRKLLQEHKVILRSANFSLYGDLSQRVMETIREFAHDVEVYSIDEAFVHIKDQAQDSLEEYTRELKALIYKRTGITVSIGVGQTKTQAKLATHIAKEYEIFQGVFILEDLSYYSSILKDLSVNEIWGIGRQLTKRLERYGIRTVYDVCGYPEVLLRKMLGSQGFFHILELKGKQCFQRDDIREGRKSITTSRSFGTLITEYADLQEALISFVSMACEKARRHDLKASHVQVYIATNRFDKKERYYSQSVGADLEHATAHTIDVLKVASELLQKIYKEGKSYKRLGVYLDGLTSDQTVQLNLLDQKSEETVAKKKELMKAVDHLNHQHGRDTVFLMGKGIKRGWSGKSNERSRNFTTNWNDVLQVK